MATFKPTSKATKTGGTTSKTFTPTKYAGYNQSKVYGWQAQNKSALDLLNEYYNRINAGEWLSNEDRAKYKSAIDTYTTTGNALRDVSKFYGTKYTDEEEKSWQDSLSSLNQGYTSVNDFYGQFADENQYNLWSRWEKPVDDVDYEKYVQTGKGSANPSWEDTRKKLFGESANVNNMVTFAENNAENAFGDALQGLRAGASGYTHTNLVNLINLYMTDEEKSRYNYYIGKGDTATAQEYLSYIENELNKRLGGEISKQVDSTVLEPFFAFESGMQSGIYGIENAVRGVLGKEGVTTSPLQYANSYSNENNKGAWKVINDLANTTGNMAPSLVIGAINPTAGAVTMGVSAGGNAYSEMLQQGYSVNQARAYGIMTGASEAALSKFLGGISKLGGNSKGVFQSLSSKVLPGVNNAIGRVAIQIGGNMADEALEEGVQTLLDPVFKWAATLGEAELEKVNWEEVGYSALLGGLSAGVLEGTPTISNAVSTNLRTQKAFGSQAQNIVADALEINPKDKMAIKAQTAINKGKQVSGLTLDALLNKTDTAKVKEAVSDRLTELGERGNVAKISDAIAREQASVEGDVATVELSDGTVAKVGLGKNTQSEVKFNDAKAEEMFRTATERIGKVDGWSVETANAMVTAFENNSNGLGVSDFTRAWSEAYNIGRNNNSRAQLNHSSYATLLDEETRSNAYNIGKAISSETKVKAQAPAKTTMPISTDTNENISRANIEVKTNDGARARIDAIKSINNDVVTVELSNGKEARIGLGKNEQRDVTFSNPQTEQIFRIATERIGKVEGWTSETASAMINAYNGQNIVAGKFAKGWQAAYNIGRNNNSMAQLNSSPLAMELDAQTRADAYNIGKAIAMTPATVSPNATYSVTFDEGIDPSTFNKKQKNDIKALEIVSKALGVNVKVFDSPVNAKGERIGKNGSYNPTTRTIEVDLHAGNHGEGIMLFTAAHEVTHHMREVARDKFNDFADAVFEALGEDGKSAFNNKLEQLQKGGHLEGMSIEEAYDLAFEEVVADSAERMLTDTDALVKLSETLKKKDKTLWEKFRDGVVNILNKLKKAYAELNPQSEAAQALMNAQDKLEKIQKLWVEGVVAAAEVSDKVIEQDLENKNVTFNERYYPKHVEDLKKSFSDMSTLSLDEILNRYQKIFEMWQKIGGELNSQFLKEWNANLGKDRSFTVFKAQAGYKYNIELSSMCKKGVPLFEAIDYIVKKEIMNELDTKVLGKAEKEILYELLTKNGFEIPCAICYVEQARQREGVIIDAFLNGAIETNSKGKVTKFKLGWNEVLTKIEKEMKTLGVDYSFEAVDRNIASDKYTPAQIIMDEKTQEAFYTALKNITNEEIKRYNKEENKNKSLITKTDPNSVNAVLAGTLPSNLKLFKTLFNEPSSRFKIGSDLLYSSMTTRNLATNHHALYSLFNAQGGVSGYKTKQGTVVYWGDILKKTWDNSVIRKEGGIRNQSNSDFQMYTLLDQVQMYLDFSAKGYYLQAYTKVLAELKLFGKSRGKINASLIPRVATIKNADGSIDEDRTRINAGLDEDGNLIFDDIEGINHKEAFMLIADPEYSKSIGGICIGYSDNHIAKMLEDKRIQLIIGFHDKTNNPDARYKGAKYSKNYNGVNEAQNSEGKTVHIGFNKYINQAEKKFGYDMSTETFAKESITYKGETYVVDDIPRLATKLYLEFCESKGYTPAYSQCDIDFSQHRNYYKLLADFSLYDSEGHYSPHRKVAFEMPDQVPYLEDGLTKYMKSEDFIKKELKAEMAVRDSIAASLADTSENGLIPSFVREVNKLHSKEKNSDRTTETNQDRLSDEESFSNRSILANALASTATNSEETELLEEYQKEIAKLDANDVKIAQYKSDLKALYEKEQPNFTVIKELSGKIKKLEGQNYYHDKKLLKLESTTALKNVLKRARKDSYAKAMQKGKELMHKNVEGRYKTIERNKIKKIAHELDTLLNKGNKKRNVKIGAQGVVRAALDLSDMYFTSDDELVMNGIKTEATDKEASAMEQYKELYEKLHATDDDVTNHKEERAEIRHEMNEIKKDFAELLERERKRINNTKAKTVYNTLIEEYEKLANSPSRHIAQAFDADTLNHIKTLRDNVGENLVREMTLEQIKDVYKAFKMVKTMVTNSNKLFNENLKESVDALGNEALHEIEKHGHKEKFTKVGKTASEFSWNNLKPVYLMERTGSPILQKLFQKVLDGESVWAKDMLDAREYIEKQKNDYKYDSWDFKKTYEFSTPSGKTFKLNLEQIMTIYAYSNRGKQAIEHLSTDGFVFDKVVVKEKGVEYELNDKTAYKITDEVRIKMTGLLTQDQKDYVDAMQKYLSKTMGAKGNEVSKAMYGIELYGEENYLPIHSEGAYLERAREQAKGDVKLKNKGFTKSTVKHARNAIVLSEFDKLCTEHIAEMSSYHAFTLPLEDFYKVYNYQVDSDDMADKRGVIPALENAYGKGATGAIDQLLTDLNGGARGDSRETIAKNLVALYKKAKVMLSLSVVIQQPSSIIRAQAMIDPKYFVGQKIGDAKRKELWAEMKKYAPVTIIKEMGYFDVGMGKASADWLLDDPTLSEKIDEIASKPAAKADELTWIAIWNAVKRETASKNTSLNTSSVEFLEKVGERFEDVIRHTQVYDSTLARSGNMRSKSALMQMATSFMAEPTTSLNMREAALRSKDARRIARTTAAIYGATLLNAVLVAIPYAMRDDDEDETFLEKYITALSTSFVDNLNPINSIPFAKDVWSLMQGYNVDRADMSAASNLIDSFNKLVKMATKEDREQGDIENAILNLIGDLSSFSGLPIDNVRRDVMSAFNTYKTLTRGYDTTWKSIEDALQRDFQKSTPVWNLFRTESKNEKLYEAVLAKDEKYVERFKSTYKDEDAYYSALRKAIRENDPRVEQAAKARLDGDNDTYYNLMYDVIGEGNFDSKLIKDAFKAEYEYLKKKQEEAEDEK